MAIIKLTDSLADASHHCTADRQDDKLSDRSISDGAFSLRPDIECGRRDPWTRRLMLHERLKLVVTLDVVNEKEWVPALVNHSRVGLVVDQLAHLGVYVVKQGVHPKASLVLRASEAEDELKD